MEEFEGEPLQVTTGDQAALQRELVRLVQQSVWANRTWADFVYSQSEVEVRPRELLGHIVIAERIFFERIEGEQKTYTTFPTMEKQEFLQRLEDHARRYEELIASRLEDVIHFRRGSGEEADARVADIIHHLLTHGYHHRGQLAAHYARKQVPYPNTDHVNYLLVNGL